MLYTVYIQCFLYNNSIYKIIYTAWDVNKQTYPLILARRPDLMIINRKKKRIFIIVDFAVTTDHRIKL